MASFVAEATERIRRDVTLPSDYHLQWGGQFENLEAATRRLGFVVPLVLVLIFGMLHFSFGSAGPAALIYLNVPFAAVGGVLALALRDLPFPISAAVGFIALFGIAVLNGVVLMTRVRELEARGETTRLEALRQACALELPARDRGAAAPLRGFWLRARIGDTIPISRDRRARSGHVPDSPCPYSRSLARRPDGRRARDDT